MLAYTLGALLSLLPQRWRDAVAGDWPVNWSRATFISGLVIGCGSLGGLLAWYLHYIRIAIAKQGDLIAPILTSAGGPKERLSDDALSFAVGLTAYVDFLFQPWTWVLAFFTIDGLWRAIAAAVNEEAPASIPFAVAERVQRAIRRRAYEARVPLVADETREFIDGKGNRNIFNFGDPAEGLNMDAVEELIARDAASVNWELRVLSCRPKKNWTPRKTIRYKGKFFQVVGESPADATAARPHAYLLRRVPPNEAFRAPEDYDPEAVLHAQEEKPSGLSRALADILENWRLRRLPRVEDRVERGDGSAGWHLRVTSCRAKPLWNRGRTVRFEETYYRVTGSFAGSPERPFGFTLIVLPENEVVRGPVDYDPGEALNL